MPGKVGNSPNNVELHLWHGVDLSFDMKWWGDSAKSQAVNLASVEGSVTSAGERLLDLAEYTTIEGNIAHVNVPAAVVTELPVTPLATWYFWLTAAVSGEVNPVATGLAVIHRA